MVRLAMAIVFLALIGASLALTSIARQDAHEITYESLTAISTASTTRLEPDDASTMPQLEGKEATTTPRTTSVSNEVAVLPAVDAKIPETTPPEVPLLSPEALNEMARAALVNILCIGEAPLRSTSGSGVIIDPRGIILTNAHVAQYFLLENADISASCVIRTGSPARSKWRAKLVFIPSRWVEKHAADLLQTRTIGTGEHDYAFLAITEAIDGQLPSSFPFIPLDIDEASTSVGEQVLLAAYPAEFVGGRAARDSLFASTVFSTIRQLLTFSDATIDVLAVSGTALAQSGSSGGGFINNTGSIIGIVVTTSFGETTGERSLHAITPSHINRSIIAHTGLSMTQLLTPPVSLLTSNFEEQLSNPLSKMLSDSILQLQN